MAMPNLTPNLAEAQGVQNRSDIKYKAIMNISSIVSQGLQSAASAVGKGYEKENDPKTRLDRKNLAAMDLKEKSVEQLKEHYVNTEWNNYLQRYDSQNGTNFFKEALDKPLEQPKLEMPPLEKVGKSPDPKPVPGEETPMRGPQPEQAPIMEKPTPVLEKKPATPVNRQEIGIEPFGYVEAPVETEQPMQGLEPAGPVQKLDPSTNKKNFVGPTLEKVGETPSSLVNPDDLRTRKDELKKKEPEFKKRLSERLKNLSLDQEGMQQLLGAQMGYQTLRMKSRTIFGNEAFLFDDLEPEQYIKGGASKWKMKYEEWEREKAPQYLNRMFEAYGKAEVEKQRGSVYGSKEDFRNWATTKYGVKGNFPADDPEAGILKHYMLKLLDEKNNPYMKTLLDDKFASRKDVLAGKDMTEKFKKQAEKMNDITKDKSDLDDKKWQRSQVFQSWSRARTDIGDLKSVIDKLTMSPVQTQETKAMIQQKKSELLVMEAENAELLLAQDLFNKTMDKGTDAKTVQVLAFHMLEQSADVLDEKTFWKNTKEKHPNIYRSVLQYERLKGKNYITRTDEDYKTELEKFQTKVVPELDSYYLESKTGKLAITGKGTENSPLDFKGISDDIREDIILDQRLHHSFIINMTYDGKSYPVPVSAARKFIIKKRKSDPTYIDDKFKPEPKG